MIVGHATSHPSDTAFIFIGSGQAEKARLSFAELDARARLLAATFREAVPGDEPLLLMVEPDLDSIVAICACLYAGVLCVPIPTPKRRASVDRIRAIATASTARKIYGPGNEVDLRRILADLTWVGGARSAEPTPLGPWAASQPAILQYTSGSTATPKGAVLTHGNIAANLDMVGEAFAVQADSRFLSWLPLHHDMGLLGALMCLRFHVPGILMSPLAFVQRPQRWLEAIAHFGATISGAPNFAYEACVLRSSASEVATLDLRRWNVAFCGAEPVKLSTLQKFADLVRSANFKPSALFPCYGLAEATTFVSGHHLLERVDSLQRTSETQKVVSCGRPPRGTIEIIDPEILCRCPNTVTGEIWVSGDHVAAGYWNTPADEATPFTATLPDRPGLRFLRTGDLGFLEDGQLHITGRLKDLIIYQGQNIHAVDIEETVAASHPSFGSTGAAFAWTVGEREHVVLVHEVVRGVGCEISDAMLEAAIDAVASQHGVRLYDLLLVRPGRIPKTTSGKVRRAHCRSLYAQGLLNNLLSQPGPQGS